MFKKTAKRMRSQVVQKAVFVYVVVFVGIVVLTAGLSYWSVAVHMKDNLDSTRIDLLKQLQQKVDLVLRGIDKTTLNLVQEADVIQFIEGSLTMDGQRYEIFNNLSNTLRFIHDANNLIYSIYIYSAPNNMIASHSTMESRSQFFDQEWVDTFNKINEISVWAGPRKVSFNANTRQSNDKNMITLIRAYPLTATGLSKKGAVAVNLNEEKLNELIRDTDSGLGQVFLMDRSGRVVSHVDKGLLNADMGSAWLGDDVQGLPPSGQRDLRINGTNGKLYFTTSAYTGWIYMNFIPEGKQEEQLGVVRNILLAVALCMVVFAIGAVLLLSNRFYRPLHQTLRSFSSQLKEGTEPGAAELYGSLPYLEKRFSQVLDDNRSMDRQIRDSKPMMKWSLLMDLLLGNRTNYEQEKPFFDLFGIRLFSSHYIVMVAEYDRPEELGSERDAQLYTYGLCNIAEQYMNAEGRGVSVQLESGKAAWIMSFEDSDPSAQMMSALSISELIRGSVEQYMKKSVSIGLSRPVVAMKGIKQAYLEALEALSYRLVFGSGMVLAIEDFKLPSNERTIELFAAREGLLEALRAGDPERTGRTFDALIDKAVRENLPPETLKQLCVQILVEAYGEAIERNADVTETFRKHGDLYQQINALQELTELRRYSHNVLSEISRLIQEKRARRGKSEALSVIIDYIDCNYARTDLSLNLIADQFEYSVSYLSRLFKEQMACNFLEYLIQTRVKAAQELLLTTNKKVADIAVEVGYSNSYSFTRIFKKQTGMTPGEYKERHVKN